MKKQIANIITSVRVLCGAIMLFFPAFSFGFYVTFLLCGISDMIDGTIARKTNAVSSFGSKFDTVADFVFMAICSIKLLPMINLPVLLWIWIAVIAMVKVANIVLGFVRRKNLADLHTILNKTTGLLLFFLPFTVTFIEPKYSLVIVCAVATIAAVQEMYYIVKNIEA